MRTLKRLGMAFLGLIAGAIFMALWQMVVPPNAATGAIMALIAVGFVWGAWKWSDRFE
jgi:hypothetical protein